MKDSQNKDTLVFLPIVHYLYHLVSRLGSQPEQLPGELELCEKFHVARGTVRRAIARLIERGIIIQLPKRRGYFSNPQFSNHGANIIGILVANGYIPSMDHTSVPLFTGFIKGIQPLHCDYNFLSLASFEPEALHSLVECTSLDGLLWIAPEDQNIPALESLLATDFPTVIIENIYQPNTVFPTSNFLHFDQGADASRRAHQIINDGCKAPLYCSDSSITPQQFQKILQQQFQIPFGTDRILPGTETLPDRITAFLDAGETDCIICDGNIRRYRTVLDTLRAHPKGKYVRVYLEKGMESKELFSHYPELQIYHLDLDDFQTRQSRVGKRAGILMNRMLRKTSSKTFKTECFQ